LETIHSKLTAVKEIVFASRSVGMKAVKYCSVRVRKKTTTTIFGCKRRLEDKSTDSGFQCLGHLEATATEFCLQGVLEDEDSPRRPHP